MSETHLTIISAPAEPCMRIELDKYGAPRTFRLLPPEETAKRWTLGGGFPFVRAKAPLFDAGTRAGLDETQWAQSDVMRKLVTLRGLLRRGTAEKENEDCFISEREISALHFLNSDTTASLAALEALTERFPRENDGGVFSAKLFQLFSEKLDRVQTVEELDFLKALFCGQKPQLLCFELYEWRDFANPVLSRETWDALADKMR